MMKTVTVNIVSRWDSSEILFSAEVDASIGEQHRLRAALEIGVKARAYLEGANLAGANLEGANLARANLARAYLEGANLEDANLAGAYLEGANLAGAYLEGAYLAGANLARAYLARAYLAGANLAGANLARAYLEGAYLEGANLAGANLAGAYLAEGLKLVGDRPFLSIGPLGSVGRTFMAWITNQGLRLRAGCFFGTRDEFIAQLESTHGENVHAKEYRAALTLIDAHVEIWAPVADAPDQAA